MSRETSDPALDVAVIGVGIGGAATTLALSQAGLKVAAFEQATEMREVGGAIIIRQPSMDLLKRWGVLEPLLPKMVKVRDLELRDQNGAVVRVVPIAFDKGEGEFAWCVHRADIHNALLSGIPPQVLHLGDRLKALTEFEGSAEAMFENGRRVGARCIVGADGLRSKVRTLLDDSPMVFNKTVTHLTIAPASLLPADIPNDRMRLWGDIHRQAVLIPIRGGAEIGISAVIPTETPPELLWGAASDEALLAHYADFDPLIPRLIRGRNVDVTTHPLYDKEPIDRWTNGQVVLMGDAAHPMAPRQGQGANQAIQDAGMLAEVLSQPPETWPEGLERFQSTRAPVTARLQRLSRSAPAVASPMTSEVRASPPEPTAR